MTIVARVLQIIDYKGINKRVFYKETSLSNGFLDKVKDIGSSKIEHILNSYPEISPEWLVTGRGDMLRRKKLEEFNKKFKQGIQRAVSNEEREVPLIPTEAFAGFGGGDVSILERDIQDRYVVPDFTNVDFMIRVKGSSMYPKFNSGDVVACKMITENTFIQWNKVHVIATKEQGVLIKRIRKGSVKDSLLAISDNESYEPFHIPKKEILNIALVTGVIRLE